MSVAITIPLIMVAIFPFVCIVIVMKSSAEDRKWTYKGQYIKKRTERLLSDRWLHCRQKPLGVVFCDDCDDCREEIEKYIDSEEDNSAN